MAIMASVVSIVGVAVALLVAPPPEPDPEVSLGVGWTVAQIHAALDAPPGPKPPPPPGTRRDRDDAAAEGSKGAQAMAGEPQGATTQAGAPASPPPPRVSVRPYAHHSDLDARIKEARRARAMWVGAALAVQGAMVIYGITRAIDNAKQAEILRNEPPPSQYKPMYPR